MATHLSREWCHFRNAVSEKDNGLIYVRERGPNYELPDIRMIVELMVRNLFKPRFRSLKL